jgi:hypothetical protein
MGYREARIAREPTPQLQIDGAVYDVDSFGMDDGWSDDPGDAFRFIFQLGSGYMIYLYVIQAGGIADPRHFFHTFWLKDCAVAEVDMEDRGPPRRVQCPPLVVPSLYQTVTLDGRELAIERQTFAADFTSGEDERATMTFALAGDATLEWDRREGWRLAGPGEAPRPLAPGARLRFGPRAG